MQTLAIYFWNLCLLRESPDKIPPSLAIAGCATALYFLVGAVSFAVNRADISFPTIIGVSAVSIAIESSALFGLLIFKQLRNRFLSTLTAIFTCNAIVLAALLPLALVTEGMDKGVVLDAINIFSFLSIVWWLTIIGNILKNAADISLVQGIVLAFVIELLVAIAIRGAFSQIG